MFSQLSFPDLLVGHLQLIAKLEALLNVGCFVYVLCPAGVMTMLLYALSCVLVSQ